VYPAAGLIDFTNAKTPIYYIDPKPIKILNLRILWSNSEIASEGMKQLKKALISLI
jgi:NAD-dependent deacetylase